MRILVVEDDAKIAEFIAKGLRQEGFTVDHAETGLDGFHLATSGSYDAAIVDIMLPKIDGLSLIEDLRRQHVSVPVLILSAKHTVSDRVRGLQAGGDDYLTKPFAFVELLARIQALIRRSTVSTEPMSVTVGDLHLDLTRRQVTRGDNCIDLQPREFSLLEYLMRNAGRVVSKTMIMEHVWGYDFDPQTNVVEARISRLRDKLGSDPQSPFIQTIRGVGYVLKDPAIHA